MKEGKLYVNLRVEDFVLNKEKDSISKVKLVSGV